MKICNPWTLLKIFRKSEPNNGKVTGENLNLIDVIYFDLVPILVQIYGQKPSELGVKTPMANMFDKSIVLLAPGVCVFSRSTPCPQSVRSQELVVVRPMVQRQGCCQCLAWAVTSSVNLVSCWKSKEMMLDITNGVDPNVHKTPTTKEWARHSA